MNMVMVMMSLCDGTASELSDLCSLSYLILRTVL